MGRRPNAIIGQYFVRGEKLNDASNRYAQTCRRCGERILKGRPETLMSHIIRRCPKISEPDRQHLYQTIQQQTSAAGTINSIAGAAGHCKAIFDRQHECTQASHTDRGETALHTLAEVSQRHVEHPSQGDADGTLQDVEKTCSEHQVSQEQVADHELLAQLQHAANMSPTSSIADPASLDTLPVRYEIPSSLPPSSPICVSGIAPSPIRRTMAPAVRSSDQAANRDRSPLLDPKLEDVSEDRANMPNQAPPAQQPATPRLELECRAPTPPTAMAATAAAAATLLDDSANETSLLTRIAKSQVRRSFDTARRQEVHKIRKRGACLRCRMLKKPCSEGTPCNTCKGVESARLWRSSCLRTRLADECSLWSKGYFVAKVKTQSCNSLQDPTLRYSSNLNGSVEAHEQRQGLERRHEDIWLLDEGAAAKVQEHLRRTPDARIRDEESPLLRATLEQAQAMLREDNDVMGENALSTQPGQDPQQQLVNNLVELWLDTSILTTFSQSSLTIQYNPSRSAGSSMASVERTSDHGSVESIPKHSEDLIFAQLLAAVEGRCSNLSKAVIAELERRLIERQRSSQFATFISAVLLLNCVERLTGFYKACAARQSDVGRSEGTGSDQGRRHSDWPLDDDPNGLWTQGAHFASLLIMLLRMRALPPRTTVADDGSVMVEQASERPAWRPNNEQTQLLAAWLDPLKLKEADLVQCRDGALPGPDADVRAWDLKFISRLLLPDKQD